MDDDQNASLTSNQPPTPSSSRPEGHISGKSTSSIALNSRSGISSKIVSNKSILTLHAYGSALVGPLLARSFHRVKKDVQESGGGVSKPHKIGLLGCIIVILGCVLGSGIFAAPEEILNMTGNAGVTLLVWFTAGCIALIAALCFVELGCTFPVSGGDYAYLKECFGNYPAFLFQISHNLIVCPVCGAIMATVIAKNLIFPNISGGSDGQDCYVGWAIRLVSVMFIMFFSFLNCKNPYITAKIQGSLMIINVCAILLMISCGLIALGMNKGMAHAHFNLKLKDGLDTKGHILVLVNALYQASFSYFGYTYVNYIMEELENPIRNLPLGVCVSIPIIIGINLLMNFCYIATLSLEEMKKTKTIADDMFRAVLPDTVGSYIAWIAPSVVAVAVSGGLLSYFLTTSRISYVGGRNGDFLPIFKLVDANHGTPVVSIVLIGVLGSIFALVGTIPQLIMVAAYLESLFNCLCIYGLIYVRWKRPHILRPVKFPLIIHILYAGISTFLFIVPIISVDGNNYKTSAFPVAGTGFVVIFGTPLYWTFVRKKQTWSWLVGFNEGGMKFCQKLWLLIPEDLEYVEEDEGKFEEFEDLRNGENEVQINTVQ